MSEPSPSKPECAPAVGYIVNTWPRLSQTFVLNEILAVEQRGVSLRIFSIKDPRREPVNAKVAKVRAPVADLRDRLARAARAKIEERFSIERSAERLLDLFFPSAKGREQC